MPEERIDAVKSPLDAALETLRSNPEIITKIADAIGMEAPTVSKSEEQDAVTVNNGDAAPASAVSSDILEKLPLVLSALKQSGGLLGGSGKFNLGALMGDPNKTALLRALCPYLSPTRRETAEGILRLWSIGDVLRKL